MASLLLRFYKLTPFTKHDLLKILNLWTSKTNKVFYTCSKVRENYLTWHEHILTWHSTCLFSIKVDNTVVTRALLTVGGGRGDLDLDLTTDEILADGMVYRDKKDQLEVAIGDGMEFTIHGQYWIYDEVCVSLLLLASSFIKKKHISFIQTLNSPQHKLYKHFALMLWKLFFKSKKLSAGKTEL